MNEDEVKVNENSESPADEIKEEPELTPQQRVSEAEKKLETMFSSDDREPAPEKTEKTVEPAEKEIQAQSAEEKQGNPVQVIDQYAQELAKYGLKVVPVNQKAELPPLIHDTRRYESIKEELVRDKMEEYKSLMGEDSDLLEEEELQAAEERFRAAAEKYADQAIATLQKSEAENYPYKDDIDALSYVLESRNIDLQPRDMMILEALIEHNYLMNSASIQRDAVPVQQGQVIQAPVTSPGHQTAAVDPQIAHKQKVNAYVVGGGKKAADVPDALNNRQRYMAREYGVSEESFRQRRSQLSSRMTGG
jgi:hypothetical protein